MPVIRVLNPGEFTVVGVQFGYLIISQSLLHLSILTTGFQLPPEKDFKSFEIYSEKGLNNSIQIRIETF